MRRQNHVAWSVNELLSGLLARELDIEKSTVDDWMDKNTVPLDANIKGLARVFATESRPASTLQRWLRVQFGLIGLRNRLSGAIGEEWTRGLFTALACYIRWTLAFHAQAKVDRNDFLLGQMRTLEFGVREETCFWVLNAWLKMEKNPYWIDDILVAQQQQGAAARIQECFEIIGDWPRLMQAWDDDPQISALSVENRRRLQIHSAMVRMSSRMFPGGLDPATMSMDNLGNEGDQAANMAKIHLGRHEYGEALSFWVKAIAAEPENAEYLCCYGMSLWRAQPHPQIDEALDQLRRACELRPEWDYPVAEIARVHLERGWPERALQHLEGASVELIESSQDCTYVLALTLAQLDRFEDARPHARRACDLDTTHADAWDLAAECAFHMGDKVECGRCAREALRLGQGRSYDRWVRRMGE